MSTEGIPHTTDLVFKADDQRYGYAEYMSLYQRGQDALNTLSSDNYARGDISEFYVLIGSGAETTGLVLTQADGTLGPENVWDTMSLNGDGDVALVSGSEGRTWSASNDDGVYTGDWVAAQQEGEPEATIAQELQGGSSPVDTTTTTLDVTKSIAAGSDAETGRTTMYACGLTHVQLVQNSTSINQLFDYVVNGTAPTINAVDQGTEFTQGDFYDEPCAVGTKTLTGSTDGLMGGVSTSLADSFSSADFQTVVANTDKSGS